MEAEQQIPECLKVKGVKWVREFECDCPEQFHEKQTRPELTESYKEQNHTPYEIALVWLQAIVQYKIEH